LFADVIEGCAPLTVNYSSSYVSDTTIVDWSWNLGAGQFSNETQTTVTYEDGGTYSPTLILTDVVGCSGSVSIGGLNDVWQPDADFSANDRTLCVGQTVNFNPADNASGNEYEWLLDEGISSNEINPSRQYNQAGSYDITLTVVDEHGCVNNRVVPAYIEVENYPIANFVADTISADCYPFLVNFLRKGAP